ncbi:arsenate reductase family protein [Paenibacillus sp. NEAU-GSW1]|uniref:arsenate reductase family protein n=1 Tax=Paenibacillus sp. NEAU-GSW1 TaxID=2682486 RepID=UPI0012E13062|nr:arsenate reductase family protein [Paenibacillus sp. NEAU-GSW1]MUT65889.1 Spx/MgsR family RNA polymerase-binding regulatory protein [Paenibacillus sp. NEAU-GSW1]
MSNKKLTVIQYPKCGTCRMAVKSLQAKGNTLELRHIVEDTPSAAELKAIVANSGLELKKFFNTSGEVYKALGLKDKLGAMSEDEQLALLASNGMLIKRPIVTDGVRVTVGYKEEQYEQTWNG